MATPLLVVWLPLVASERFEGALTAALVAFATLSVGLSLARGRLLPAAPYTLGLAALAAMHAADVAEGSALELVGAAVATLSTITTHLLSLSASSRDRLGNRGLLSVEIMAADSRPSRCRPSSERRSQQ